MNWIGRWLLVTGILSLSSLLAALLFERAFTEAADVLLAPWFSLCGILFPEAWQTQGNILLGMTWLFTGVALYSMLIGAVCVGFLSRVEKLRVPNKALEERS